ncbi:hypothetical protein ACJX0J_020369, partial [Zea mays]
QSWIAPTCLWNLAVGFNISSHDTESHSSKEGLRPSDSGNSNNVGVYSFLNSAEILTSLESTMFIYILS